MPFCLYFQSTCPPPPSLHLAYCSTIVCRQSTCPPLPYYLHLTNSNTRLRRPPTLSFPSQYVAYSITCLCHPTALLFSPLHLAYRNTFLYRPPSLPYLLRNTSYPAPLINSSGASVYQCVACLHPFTPTRFPFEIALLQVC